MQPWLALLALVGFWLAGAPGLSLLLLAAASALGAALSLRLANQLRSGTGGHAEWVRDMTTRRAAIRSPGWVVAWLLLAAGIAVGVSGG